MVDVKNILKNLRSFNMEMNQIRGFAHTTMKAYKYRIYPTPKQVKLFEQTLATCRCLYNSALEERINRYKKDKYSITYTEQQNSLPLNKNENQKLVYSQVLQSTLRKLDTSFKNFFRRLKKKRKVGFPRFKPEHRYNSFYYPQKGFRLTDNNKRVELSKIGSIRLIYSRHINGTIKTCTIKRDIDQWYVIFVTDHQEPIKTHGQASTQVGIDLGINNLCALSTGELIPNPHYYLKSQEILKKEQIKLSRKTKGSYNRNKQRIKVARVHRKTRFQRDDYLHKLSKKLTHNFETIVFEDLNIKGMVKNRNLAKHILDSSWNKLVQYTSYKAESAGGKVVLVDPKNTSQLCSQCGKKVPKTLSVRVHKCDCGHCEDRDVNASRNILKRKNRVGTTRIHASGDLSSTQNSFGFEQAESLKEEALLL